MIRFLRRLTRHSFGVRNRAPWGRILSHTVNKFDENELFTSAAAMSYFGLLTIFPALLLLLGIGNRFAAGNEIISRLLDVYPGSGKFLRETLGSLAGFGRGAIFSCVIVVLWAGSWVFAIVERALNRIWKTTSRTFLHGRALTLAMIGAVGLLLSVSVFFTSVLVTIQQWALQIPIEMPKEFWLFKVIGSAFWQLLLALGSILMTVSLFILVYRFMPNSPVTFRDTLPGAVAGGCLWELAKYVFAWSLQYFHYDQIYGSVGAVVSVLTWSYVSSLILLLGAQLTQVLHLEHEEETETVVPAAAATASSPT